MAQTNIYLKLEDLPGESVDDLHKNWIEIECFTWGVHNPASFAIGQGGQATQATVANIDIDKRCDKSSVAMFKACTTGKHIKKGIISCLKLDGETRIEYLKLELTDIMVSDFKWEGRGEDQLVKEKVSLCFAEFKETYKLQEDTGSSGGGTDFGFNVQTSKAT
ncbi:MAG: type VI secretion system tube protein Hcp [Xanthobacteraceae bacterium]